MVLAAPAETFLCKSTTLNHSIC
uniref:Uncharacterized protein n=1 Tax=Rhizophora mucronata TaxID=61149 RepID=A0A2P2N8N2_RHIMU